MESYEIVIDGELTADLADSLGPLPRTNRSGATVLSVPINDPPALARVLGLLESLGIGVTAIRRVDDPAPARGFSAFD